MLFVPLSMVQDKMLLSRKSERRAWVNLPTIDPGSPVTFLVCEPEQSTDKVHIACTRNGCAFASPEIYSSFLSVLSVPNNFHVASERVSIP